MTDYNKLLSELLNNTLSEDIDSSTVQDLADHIEKCEDCIVDVDTIQQTIKLCRTGDFEYLIPQNVSKRLLKILDLDD